MARERGDAAVALLGLAPLGGAASAEPSVPQLVGSRVALARMRAGLSGAKLGALVGLAADQISKIEHGVRVVRPDTELPALARALGVTARYLSGTGEPARLALAHRLSQPTAVEDPEAVPATQRRALDILRVEDRLAEQTELDPPRVSVSAQRVLARIEAGLGKRPRNRAEARRQGAELAGVVRKELDLGSSEIADLPELIEMHFGADVALSPLGTSVDGLCAHADGVALIVVSSDFPDGHVRFTLAHELGHHLLRDPREVIDELGTQMFANSLDETRVNAFAAHLLMPADGVTNTLEWLAATPSDLVEANTRGQRALGTLIGRFGVSLHALLIRLAELNVITAQDAEQLRGRLRDGDLIQRVSAFRPAGDHMTGRVRAPQRLLVAAAEAAAEDKIGLGALSVLLEEDDEDALYERFATAAFAN